MNTKNILGFVLALAFMGNVAYASDKATSVNNLSTGYDAKARYEPSQNDVIGFIYQWFAAFDHQREAGYFLNRISPSARLIYPDYTVNSHDDFLHWYKGVTDNIQWNSHQLTDLKVEGN
ncbi:hypothetical protein [Neptuniibacter sp. QD48_11]|uniref:hypothetical protein n=1 Tax=unclassified Neptuniibacter TaxID=2630693 RepID=UPI0039F486FB